MLYIGKDIYTEYTRMSILLIKADKIEPLSINSSTCSCNLFSALMRGHCNKPQTRKMGVIYIVWVITPSIPQRIPHTWIEWKILSNEASNWCCKKNTMLLINENKSPLPFYDQHLFYGDGSFLTRTESGKKFASLK